MEWGGTTFLYATWGEGVGRVKRNPLVFVTSFHALMNGGKNQYNSRKRFKILVFTLSTIP